MTYLYGEANAEEARDFAGHMRQCDACRAEFAVFNQVHDSIVAWRNEALGPMTTATDTAFVPERIVQHERKLSALAALREFFSVSPLWLRGATAFAGLLLVALLFFAASRLRQPPVQVADGNSAPAYTRQDMEKEVQKRVDAEIARRDSEQNKQTTATVNGGSDQPRSQVAVNRVKSKRQQTANLTREERVQLAADLGLISGREEDLPFVLPDEPNQ